MNNTSMSTYILAGGVGSRFWPKSRSKMPKQFIDILGTGKSLLQMTVERFLPLVKYSDINIITHSDYKQLVNQQLNFLNNGNVLCEPLRRNTAACIAYAAFKEFNRDPDSVMVVVPSDHLIIDQNTFLEKIDIGVNYAYKNDVIVTLGIPPTRPDTGYGYIHYDKNEESIQEKVYKIISFKEKPRSELAIEYLKSGDYLWNAGIFIAKASTIIKAFEEHSHEIFDLFKSAVKYFDTVEEDIIIDKIYKEVPEISFDFAVIEKTDNLYVINADIGWSDLGTWESLYQVSDNKDLNGNLVCASNIILYETENCIINASPKRLVIAKGISNFIIVDSNDVTLIYPRSEEQKIKDVLKEVGDQNLDLFI